jgi:hypothetical protein
LASGYSLLLDANQIRQGERIFRILGLQREIPSRSPSLSWSACIGRKRKKRELARVRVCMAEFKFEFEYI